MTSVDPFSQLADQAPAPSGRVLDALREEMKSDDKPRQSLSRGKRVAFSVLALGVGLTLTTLKAAGNDPGSFVLALAATSLSLGALLFAGAIPGNGRFTAGNRKGLLAVLCVGLVTVLALSADQFLPFAQFTENASLTHTMKCASHSLMAGIIASSGLMIVWRRTDPFSPGLTGALLGFFGGVIGTVSVGLACAASEGFHLTLGHGAGALLLGVAGYAFGRKWLSP